MNFDLTETQDAIRDAARRIATDRIAPHAAALDRGEAKDTFLANLKLLAENGFMGLGVQAEHGGTEAGTVAFALAIEEIGAACAATGVTTSVTNMVAEVIQAVGSPEQKAQHLPAICDGSYAAGAFCLTESGAGSDPSGMRTTARRDGNHFVLDGEKIYITSAPYAGVFVVWAVTDKAAPKGKGISCFLVEAGTPGLHVGRAEPKTGQTGSATATVTFDGCRVPATSMMGRENDGFRVAVGELAGGRIGIGALSLGIARSAIDKAKAYLLEREQFGRKLAEFQGLQWMLADREVDLAAARLLIMEAAWTKEQGKPFARQASMAKLFASEAAQRCTDTAVQIFGGAGYMREAGIERLARDARITRIYEGTSEVQRLVIARETLKAMA